MRVAAAPDLANNRSAGASVQEVGHPVRAPPGHSRPKPEHRRSPSKGPQGPDPSAASGLTATAGGGSSWAVATSRMLMWVLISWRSAGPLFRRRAFAASCLGFRVRGSGNKFRTPFLDLPGKPVRAAQAGAGAQAGGAAGSGDGWGEESDGGGAVGAVVDGRVRNQGDWVQGFRPRWRSV